MDVATPEPPSIWSVSHRQPGFLGWVLNWPFCSVAVARGNSPAATPACPAGDVGHGRALHGSAVNQAERFRTARGGSLLWRGGWRQGIRRSRFGFSWFGAQPVYPVRRVRMAVRARLFSTTRRTAASTDGSEIPTPCSRPMASIQAPAMTNGSRSSAAAMTTGAAFALQLKMKTFPATRATRPPLDGSTIATPSIRQSPTGPVHLIAV